MENKKSNSTPLTNKVLLVLIGLYGLYVLYETHINNSPAFYSYATLTLFAIATQVLYKK
ncbi:hypothetical protein M2325_000716 [Methanococcus voltae PS]|uniref:Uncharacterized protein n=1 Tax=Methanococcus voltae PS TaxID=523842 RepID=A0ABT2EX77_METVO|nr:hypothetical protein [Methanococcus voltae PS]